METVARREVADALEVLAARLDLAPERVRSLSGWLSDGERRRAARFRLERDRRRFVVARARLRQLLAARLAVDPRSLEIVCGTNGKPHLGPEFAHTGWRFNVSHCGELAVYAFSRGGEIGIDVEAVRAVPEADAIAARFFSRRENQAYLALATHDRPLGFFNCWTRKEAFVKALGEGLSMPLEEFDVSLAPGEPAQLLRIGRTPGKDSAWRLHSFSPLPGFIAALASHR